MTDKPPFRIANMANNPDPNWVWLKRLLPSEFVINGRRLQWTGYSTAPELNAKSKFDLKLAQRIKTVGRYRAVKQLISDARNEPFDLIVTHGPWPTAWTGNMLGAAKADSKHLAFSFNFTDLPTGFRRSLMTRAFETVDHFAVFTNTEQDLYEHYFGIDRSKILRAPWGVRPPLSAAPPKQIEGDYFAALGGEARDYGTLCEAARRCPEIKFVAIARPYNFDRLNPPENLEVLFNLQFEKAWAIVWHAAAALIPLRSRETPCGLVTLVGGMHLGKAQIVTEAVGVTDYIENKKTGLTVPEKDPAALAAAIRAYAENPDLAAAHGEAAKAYAAMYCSEQATIAFFEAYLSDHCG